MKILGFFCWHLRRCFIFSDLWSNIGPMLRCFITTVMIKLEKSLASSGGEVRLYDPNANQLEIARRYVEAELPRVVAGQGGALAGRLVLSAAVQAACGCPWVVVEAIQEV